MPYPKPVLEITNTTYMYRGTRMNIVLNYTTKKPSLSVHIKNTEYHIHHELNTKDMDTLIWFVVNWVDEFLDKGN